MFNILNSGLKYLNDLKAFIEYANDMDDIYKSVDEYSPNKKRKILILFDDLIADMLSKKKLSLIVTELFIRGTKLLLLSHNLVINNIFWCAKIYYLKFNTLFCYEDYKEKRTSTN